MAGFEVNASLRCLTGPLEDGRLAFAGFSDTKLLRAMIPGFGQIEASSVALVSMALVTMAAVASWLPALTATKVDPVVALRYE